MVSRRKEQWYKEQIILPKGELIANRYRVSKCLGRGGMGAVYAVEDTKLKNHLKALKLLWPDFAAAEDIMERLQREIICSYDISHKNVVRAFEYINEAGHVGYTMELIQGSNLATLMKKKKRLNPRTVHFIIQEICSGLLAIHEGGIIHRDLKPSNILISTKGELKISDFGVAYCRDEKHLTDARDIVGTFEYLSPEYLKKRIVDERSDIYAVGVIAYRMLAGVSPFRGLNVLERVEAKQTFVPTPVQALAKKCPGYLSTLITTCMNRNPEERYQSVAEILQALNSPTAPSHSTSLRRTESVQVAYELFHKRRQLLQRILLFLLLVLVIRSYIAERMEKKLVPLDRQTATPVLQPSDNYELPPEANTYPEFPRLRASSKLSEEWTWKIGQLYLIGLKVKVTNFTAVDAEDVEVRAVLSNGFTINLDGPRRLAKYSSAEYEKILEKKASQREKLSLRITCSNCRQ